MNLILLFDQSLTHKPHTKIPQFLLTLAKKIFPESNVLFKNPVVRGYTLKYGVI